MATFDYDEARLVAEEIITEFGEPLQIIKEGEPPGEDQYGRPTTGTDDIVIDGICSPLLDYDSSMMGAYNEENSLIQAGDKFAYYHSDTNPEIGMTLTANGVKYLIKSIVWLSSLSGVRVYTKIQLRS